MRTTAVYADTEQAPSKPRGKLKRVTAGTPTPKPQKRASKPLNGNGSHSNGARPYSRSPDGLDVYGFRKGSLKSQAVALYAAKKGATIPEVQAKIGSRQFNVIQELEERGFKFLRTQESGVGKRPVTRFKLVSPSKAT